MNPTIPFFGVSLVTFLLLLAIGMFIGQKWPNNVLSKTVHKAVSAT